MSYRVSYPVVDEALANFLLLVLVFAVSVVVAVGVGSYFGVLDSAVIVEQMGRFVIDHAFAA
jgi:hypothetical protein